MSSVGLDPSILQPRQLQPASGTPTSCSSSVSEACSTVILYATQWARSQADTCLLPVSVLLVNAIAILSEDRFLARSTHLHLYCREIATDNIQTVGWGSTQQEPAFGGPSDNTSVKSKVINLISSVRTLMRSTCSSCVCRISCADFSPYSTAYRHQHSHHRLRTYTGMKDYTRACA